MKAMLDTSVCIEIMRGRKLPDSFRSCTFLVSSIVESELWAGVYQSGGIREKQKVQRLLSAVEVREFDSLAAEKTGFVLGELAREGMKIGDFDSLIAGHCMALGYPLITQNLRHFERVPQLEVIPVEMEKR